MVGEEERRRSTTPGTESQRPPQPLGTREAMPVPASAEAMTSGRPHFGGGSLRSGRDTAPTDGGVYDSWDEDGSGAEASLPARRAAAAVSLAPNVGPDSECLASTRLKSAYRFRENEEVAVQPMRPTSAMSRARGRSTAQSVSQRSQLSRGEDIPSSADVEPWDQPERGYDATQHVTGSHEGASPHGSNSDQTVMARMLQRQRDLADVVSQVRQEVSRMNHRVNSIEDQWQTRPLSPLGVKLRECHLRNEFNFRRGSVLW